MVIRKRAMGSVNPDFHDMIGRDLNVGDLVSLLFYHQSGGRGTLGIGRVKELKVRTKGWRRNSYACCEMLLFSGKQIGSEFTRWVPVYDLLILNDSLLDDLVLAKLTN